MSGIKTLASNLEAYSIMSASLSSVDDFDLGFGAHVGENVTVSACSKRLDELAAKTDQLAQDAEKWTTYLDSRIDHLNASDEGGSINYVQIIAERYIDEATFQSSKLVNQVAAAKVEMKRDFHEAEARAEEKSDARVDKMANVLKEGNLMMHNHFNEAKVEMRKYFDQANDKIEARSDAATVEMRKYFDQANDKIEARSDAATVEMKNHLNERAKYWTEKFDKPEPFTKSLVDYLQLFFAFLTLIRTWR